MSEKYSPSLFVKDFRFGFEKNREALNFIIQHRLWEGFWKFGWVMRLLLFAGFLAGWKLFKIFRHWYADVETDNVVALTQSVGLLFNEMATEGYQFMFLSGFKYVVLVLVEIIVFHFVRRTLELKTGIQQDFTPKHFIRAQIRMIKIVIRNFILESIAIILVSMVLGLFGVEWMKTFISLLIQAYFLGFAMIDNYNELFGMSIKQSDRLTRHYSGLSVAIGLTTYFLLLIPVLGAFLAPFFVAVTATLAFHDLRLKEGGWRYDWELASSNKKEPVL